MNMRALVSALAAAGAPSLAQALGEAFDPRLVALIVVGIGAGLAGGLARALVPWGQSSWGWRDGAKSIALGLLVGGGAALLLEAAASVYAVLALPPPGRMVVEGLAGYLAARVLEQVDTIGPRGFLEWLLRRTAPATPKEKDAP